MEAGQRQRRVQKLAGHFCLEVPLSTQSVGESVLTLIHETLRLIKAKPERVSAALRNGVRIARQTGSHIDLFWLRLELIDSKQQHAVNELFQDLMATVPHEQYENVANALMNRYSEDRSYDYAEGFIWNIKIAKHYNLDPIDDIEKALAKQRAVLNEDTTGLRSIQAERLNEVYKSLLARVRHRLFDFLTRIEQLVLVGHISSDIFQSYRQVVDERLSKIAPEVLEQFTSIFQRVSAGDKEARSHALTSCRRVIKALADAVYPATDEMVVGKDGKEQPLDDSHYLLRLRHYVKNVAAKHKSGDVLRAQIGDLESRITALNSLASKGTHAQATIDELYQCAIQTYLVAGDVLRLQGTKD